MGGGFRGKAYVISANDSIGLPYKDFKYKHQAIITNGYLMVHNYNGDDLQKKLSMAKKNF